MGVGLSLGFEFLSFEFLGFPGLGGALKAQTSGRGQLEDGDEQHERHLLLLPHHGRALPMEQLAPGHCHFSGLGGGGVGLSLSFEFLSFGFFGVFRVWGGRFEFEF